MEPVDPKRRGRGLFGARRRHEAASEAAVDEQHTPKPEHSPGDPVIVDAPAPESGTDDAEEDTAPPTGIDEADTSKR